MTRNFVINGIISSNCFEEDNQIDINVSITPKNNFLKLLNNMIEEEIKNKETVALFKDDIFEGLSLLIVLNSNDKKEVKKLFISYVQLETMGSYIEDYATIFDSVVTKEEIDEVRQYVFDFLIKRENQSKLWTNYLA